MVRKTIFVVLVFALSINVSQGQVKDLLKDYQQRFDEGKELYDQEQYNAAILIFEDLIHDLKHSHSQIKVNSELYEAVCSFELLHKDAPQKLARFMERHSNHSNVNIVRFYLGKDAFDKRKYAKTLRYLKEVETSSLSPDQRIELMFKQAYCYFRLHKEKKAQVHFKKLMNGKSKYASVSHYYYAHIAYMQGQDDVAVQEFTKLLRDSKFKKIAPYYLLQLDFKAKKYKKVISSGKQLYEVASRKRKPEIARVMAESYYRLEKYEKAIPYFEDYKKLHRVSRDESFELGFCYFKTGQINKAVPLFEKASKGKDTLAQYAYYHLANAYLKNDKKQFAKNAYKSAYQLGFDRNITENSLFNHAQLAFELSSDPYSEAIKALKAYLKAYPDSEKHDEAYQFLYKISLSTKNYEYALKAIENIKNKTTAIHKQYQKILYYRSLKYVEEHKWKKAKESLTQTIEHNYSPQTTALANFWIGELFFQEGNYWAAKKYYETFINSKSAKNTELYEKAYYGLGYVHFNRKKYWEALNNFKKYVGISNDSNGNTVSDALLRMADSYFMLKRYQDAQKYYKSAMDNGSVDKDYATYQEAMIYGALRNQRDKIKTLQGLISHFKRSIYVPKAYYELGNTYLIVGDYDKAMKNYKSIVKRFPNNTLTVKARLKMGLIYTNTGQEDLALKTFKGVVADYAGTATSKEALVSIENIYTDMNKVDDFFKYVKTLSFADVSLSKQDSLSFTAAENTYFNGNCKEAISSFDKYIKKYSQGQNIIKASYYKADCHIKLGETDPALEDLLRVISYPKNAKTEGALKKAAKIYMDKKDFAKAKEMYVKLKEMAESKENILIAQYGKLKCEYQLKENDSFLNTFDELIKMDNLEESKKVEAYLMKAKTELNLDVKDLAYRDFEKVIELSDAVQAAESQYNLAYLKFMDNDIKSAEKFIFEMINKYSAYDYWVAKSFILLADVYLKKGNQYQAEQTLESIIDNYEGEGNLKDIAINKLRILKEGDQKMTSEQEEEDGEEVLIDSEF
jgi:tetratricopeptide (TPR) repeat protein